jgi:hypothetical protein
VYDKAHIVSEDVKIQHGELKAMNKDLENHLYLNHSKQKIEIIKTHVLYLKSSFLHMTREREREMSESWIPKGYSVNTWEPKTWIQHKCTQLIMRVSKRQNLVQKCII